MTPLSQALKRDRSTRLNAALSEAGIDVLAVVGNHWRTDALRYCTGAAVSEGHAVALVERDGDTRIMVESPAEAERIGAENPELAATWSKNLFEDAEKVLRTMDKRRVALAPRAALPFGLASAIGADQVDRATALLERLLIRKSPVELQAVRRAAVLADDGYKVFMAAAREGRREYELVADVEAFFRSRGCPDNFQILASGGLEVRGMHPPGERQLTRGDLVTTELTPCVEGYYAQVCRTLVLGAPTATQQRVFSIYNEAMEAGIDAVRPGTTASAVAKALNDVFRAHGLGDFVTAQYTRVRGHALGLGTGQKPSILEDVHMPLEEGMTLIVHPNTFHPEVGYFVHGDTLCVTATGCEVLCATARRLFAVPLQ